MATIRKRGTSWHVQIRRKGYPTKTGSFSTKAEANAWAKETERWLAPVATQLEAPKEPKDQVTVADLIERYRVEVSAVGRSAKHHHYRIKLMQKAAFAKVAPAELTSTMLAEWRDLRLKTVKPGTLRVDFSILGSCLELARREWGFKELNPNPVKDVKLPPANNARKRRLVEGEHKRIAEALQLSKSFWFPSFVALAIETGMRRSELLSVQWSNIDLKSRTLFLPLTKNGHERTIPLTPTAIKVLQDYRIKQKTGRFNRETKREFDPDRLFQIDPCTVSDAWTKLCKRAGISGLRMHDLRHEAISRFFEIGLSVPEVATISGHRDLRMLFRYTHIKPENIATKLAELSAAETL